MHHCQYFINFVGNFLTQKIFRTAVEDPLRVIGDRSLGAVGLCIWNILSSYFHQDISYLQSKRLVKTVFIRELVDHVGRIVNMDLLHFRNILTN